MTSAYSLLMLVGLLATDPPGVHVLDTMPLPEGAKDVHRTNLASYRSQQLYFAIEVAFPSKLGSDYYGGLFRDKGWRKCEGRSADWFFFLEDMNDSTQLVHQYMEYWVEPDFRQMTMLTIRYLSDWEGKTRPPTNTRQHVFVVVMDGDAGSIQEEIEILELQCQFDAP